ncbi:hypothetical protein [Nocardia sp. CA-120079]|uniref:hypothetical protein n=1 Tax=Nocardia sp. CA-120079 TaxID=3239974 RepID=UPI003D986D5D
MMIGVGSAAAHRPLSGAVLAWEGRRSGDIGIGGHRLTVYGPCVLAVAGTGVREGRLCRAEVLRGT